MIQIIKSSMLGYESSHVLTVIDSRSTCVSVWSIDKIWHAKHPQCFNLRDTSWSTLLAIASEFFWRRPNHTIDMPSKKWRPSSVAIMILVGKSFTKFWQDVLQHGSVFWLRKWRRLSHCEIEIRDVPCCAVSQADYFAHITFFKSFVCFESAKKSAAESF